MKYRNTTKNKALSKSELVQIFRLISNWEFSTEPRRPLSNTSRSMRPKRNENWELFWPQSWQWPIILDSRYEPFNFTKKKLLLLLFFSWNKKNVIFFFKITDEYGLYKPKEDRDARVKAGIRIAHQKNYPFSVKCSNPEIGQFRMPIFINFVTEGIDGINQTQLYTICREIRLIVTNSDVDHLKPTTPFVKPKPVIFFSVKL